MNWCQDAIGEVMDERNEFKIRFGPGPNEERSEDSTMLL